MLMTNRSSRFDNNISSPALVSTHLMSTHTVAINACLQRLPITFFLKEAGSADGFMIFGVIVI
jgi:hypothetical protein